MAGCDRADQPRRSGALTTTLSQQARLLLGAPHLGGKWTTIVPVGQAPTSSSQQGHGRGGSSGSSTSARSAAPSKPALRKFVPPPEAANQPLPAVLQTGRHSRRSAASTMTTMTTMTATPSLASTPTPTPQLPTLLPRPPMVRPTQTQPRRKGSTTTTTTATTPVQRQVTPPTSPTSPSPTLNEAFGVGPADESPISAFVRKVMDSIPFPSKSPRRWTPPWDQQHSDGPAEVTRGGTAPAADRDSGASGNRNYNENSNDSNINNNSHNHKNNHNNNDGTDNKNVESKDNDNDKDEDSDSSDPFARPTKPARARVAKSKPSATTTTTTTTAAAAARTCPDSDDNDDDGGEPMTKQNATAGLSLWSDSPHDAALLSEVLQNLLPAGRNNIETRLPSADRRVSATRRQALRSGGEIPSDGSGEALRLAVALCRCFGSLQRAFQGFLGAARRRKVGQAASAGRGGYLGARGSAQLMLEETRGGSGDGLSQADFEWCLVDFLQYTDPRSARGLFRLFDRRGSGAVCVSDLMSTVDQEVMTLESLRLELLVAFPTLQSAFEELMEGVSPDLPLVPALFAEVLEHYWCLSHLQSEYLFALLDLDAEGTVTLAQLFRALDDPREVALHELRLRLLLLYPSLTAAFCEVFASRAAAAAAAAAASASTNDKTQGVQAPSKSHEDHAAVKASPRESPSTPSPSLSPSPSPSPMPMPLSPEPLGSLECLGLRNAWELLDWTREVLSLESFRRALLGLGLAAGQAEIAFRALRPDGGGRRTLTSLLKTLTSIGPHVTLEGLWGRLLIDWPAAEDLARNCREGNNRHDALAHLASGLLQMLPQECRSSATDLVATGGDCSVAVLSRDTFLKIALRFDVSEENASELFDHLLRMALVLRGPAGMSSTRRRRAKARRKRAMATRQGQQSAHLTAADAAAVAFGRGARVADGRPGVEEESQEESQEEGEEEEQEQFRESRQKGDEGDGGSEADNFLRDLLLLDGAATATAAIACQVDSDDDLEGEAKGEAASGNGLISAATEPDREQDDPSDEVGSDDDGDDDDDDDGDVPSPYAQLDTKEIYLQELAELLLMHLESSSSGSGSSSSTSLPRPSGTGTFAKSSSPRFLATARPESGPGSEPRLGPGPGPGAGPGAGPGPGPGAQSSSQQSWRSAPQSGRAAALSNVSSGSDAAQLAKQLTSVEELEGLDGLEGQGQRWRSGTGSFQDSCDAAFSLAASSARSQGLPSVTGTSKMKAFRFQGDQDGPRSEGGQEGSEELKEGQHEESRGAEAATRPRELRRLLAPSRLLSMSTTATQSPTPRGAASSLGTSALAPFLSTTQPGHLGRTRADLQASEQKAPNQSTRKDKSKEKRALFSVSLFPWRGGGGRARAAATPVFLGNM